MRSTLFKNIIRFVLLVILQVLVLNNINLGGYVNPFLYIFFVLMLPFETPGWLLLFSSFFLGLSIDVFTHTPGLHASASVLIAFLRPIIIRAISTNKEFEAGMRPSLFDMGIRWYLLYSIILITIHHIYLFFMEAFSFTNFFATLSQAIMSAAITIGLAYLSQFVFYSRKR